MAGSGGGQSGTVGFPVYLEAQHEDWLTTDLKSMKNFIDERQDGPSPYTSAFAFNPEPELDDAQRLMDELNDKGDAFDATTEWEDALDTVTTKLDSTLLTTSEITSAVARFNANQVAEFQKGLSRTAGGFADINSVSTPAFVIGAGMVEMAKQRSSDDFDSKLELQQDRERTFAALQSTAELLKAFVTEFDFKRASSAMQLEMSKMTIISQSERLEQELAIDVNDFEYDMHLFSYGQNLMSAISGAPTIPRPTPKFKSALGGLVGGAASFGQLGAALGPEGAIFGALLGGAGGLFGGLL